MLLRLNRIHYEDLVSTLRQVHEDFRLVVVVPEGSWAPPDLVLLARPLRQHPAASLAATLAAAAATAIDEQHYVHHGGGGATGWRLSNLSVKYSINI